MHKIFGILKYTIYLCFTYEFKGIVGSLKVLWFYLVFEFIHSAFLPIFFVPLIFYRAFLIFYFIIFSIFLDEYFCCKIKLQHRQRGGP
jgi:hypothetical protein